VTNSCSKKIALVFPGQGSQAVGMGKELAESFPAAADAPRRHSERSEESR
jgi:[acyl-carrier-protein] S-malonyltransferase